MIETISMWQLVGVPMLLSWGVIGFISAGSFILYKRKGTSGWGVLSAFLAAMFVLYSIIFIMALSLGELNDNYRITGEVEQVLPGFIQLDSTDKLIKNDNAFIREGDDIVVDYCNDGNVYVCDSLEKR